MNEIGLAKIESMIYIIRGQKVIIDSDLAELYGVETKALKRAVRRNINRLPSDFMFEMSEGEPDQYQKKLETKKYLKLADGKEIIISQPGTSDEDLVKKKSFHEEGK